MLIGKMHLFPRVRYRRIIAYLFILVIGGSLGYYILGGRQWTILDSVYMTIITLSTVGYREIHDLNALTTLWTIIIIVFGVTCFAVIASQFAKEIADLKSYRRRRMEHQIEKMKNHYIICGFGRMGEVISDELNRKKEKFVVIEQRNMNVEYLDNKNFKYLLGDATGEEILLKAGVEKARGVVVVLGSDPDNLFVTMTARTLNPDAYILARCSTIGSNMKFKRAGADKVVNPYIAGGHKMAELLLEPGLNDTVQIATDLEIDTTLELGIDQMELANLPYLDGKALSESKLREDYNLMVLAIVEQDGEIILNPISSNVLRTGQKIMLTGKKDDLVRFKERIVT